MRVFFMYIVPPLVALVAILLPAISTITILPRIGVSPGFVLMNQYGETVTSESLRGDVIVFGIISLNCDAACDATLAAMSRVDEEFGQVAGDADERPEVRLVTIIVDAVENPGALQQFATAHAIDGEGWNVLSGSEAAVRAVVASGFDVRLDRSGGVVNHDPGVFLTDHAGFMRAEYRSGNPRADVIGGDIERILDEATAGGVGGLFYNAAHSLSLSCGG